MKERQIARQRHWLKEKQMRNYNKNKQGVHNNLKEKDTQRDMTWLVVHTNIFWETKLKIGKASDEGEWN